ncbi:hypothetical protein KPL71_004249 [Citrus sinensis]|uniref:Uncharacterized protein n=1 Tax=Citrus sinensis TaxID=2711 RepID=A0ACB8N4D4_CITSI|nr:hypothetical protein KPL71_004249 [Citrus sinensis]
MEATSSSISTPSSSSSHISLSSTLSLPKSCSKHLASKIENLVEYSYILESAQIHESQFPIMSPYSLYKQKTSFTRSIRTLISTKRPLPKEYIQSSRLEQCALQASQSEQCVTLEIPQDLVANWKREGYTHLHLGGVRLILTLYGRKGLPVTARIALLDTRFKQYQHAIIGTVLTTLHAGSVLLTFYPNFNLSLEYPNLPMTLKVQIQLQGAEQTTTSKIATLYHQIVYRLHNHALDLPTPHTTSDALMILLSYTAMIIAVQTGQEKKLPIHGFSSEGYPVYPDKINGHFLWDVLEAHMCNPDCPCLDDTDIDDELEVMRRKKIKKNKSSRPITSFTASGQPEEPKQYEVVLNWQPKNANAQNQTLQQLRKKIDRVASQVSQTETKVDSISNRLDQMYIHLQDPVPPPIFETYAPFYTPSRPQQPVYNQFFGFSHLQPTPQPKPSSPKKSKSKVKISEPKSKATSSSSVPPVPPEDSPKGPMDQYHYHTVQNTFSDSSEPETIYESNPSESNPSSSSSSTNSVGTSTDSESEYADITSILMATKTEDPSTSTTTPIVEDSSSDAETKASPTELEPSMPPPVPDHSTKPSSTSWFTFDDIPRHKWPA